MILIDTQKEEFNKLKHVRIFSKVENENRFNGDLLVIGLGGVGGRVVTALKRMMLNNITREDNINFLLIDSDIPAMEATIKDSKEGYGLNALEVLSIYRPNLGDIMTRGFNSMPVQESLAKWMSPDFPRVTIGTSGAEGNRQIGRLMFSNAYEDMRSLKSYTTDQTAESWTSLSCQVHAAVPEAVSWPMLHIISRHTESPADGKTCVWEDVS